MSLKSTKYLWALAISAALAACTPRDDSERTLNVPPNSTGIESGRMIVEGNPGTIVLSNIGAMMQTLEKYAPGAVQGNPGMRIDYIRAANLDTTKAVPGLTGLGGIIGHAFLDMADDAVAMGGNFNPRVRVITSLSGKILDFRYDDATGSGTIDAVTYVTRSKVTPGAGAPPPHTVAYRYVVNVGNNGFTVVNHSGNRNDPFPGTLAFSPEMLDRVESLGFLYKLWAKGTTIQVADVWVIEDFDWGTAPEWGDPIAHDDPKYARLFRTDSESCIDMMFVAYPPPMLGGMGPPFYCLGRCRDPMLINTK